MSGGRKLNRISQEGPPRCWCFSPTTIQRLVGGQVLGKEGEKLSESGLARLKDEQDCRMDEG